ncbi:hypothetical protein K469DRAFT_683785 [Zopfia rhizophila CBS 207.26]|uniref:Uncharacterized protein n=1 Tax=Zopfia rhizophila CBS 207.26 TaxID=1314779 RepID=A0A6A6ECB3_9PEZI|nr:hypothetical protein K469DRAFT_683785 [Zopfia rhizophila CBS 207.26]
MRKPNDCLPDKPKEQKEKFERIQSIVQSYRFWEQLSGLKKFLEPFLQVAIALESVRPQASRIFAYFRFLLWEIIYTTSLPSERIKEIIGKRFQDVYKPIMTIAYICDPLAREERQVPINQAMDDGMQNYLSKTYGFDEGDGQTTLISSPLKIREILLIGGRTRIVLGTSKILLSTPSASIIRQEQQNAIGAYQNKSRNRLGNPKVEMLVYLFTNLRIRDQINSEDPQYFDDGEVEEEEPEVLDDDDSGDLSQVIEGLAIAKEIDEMAKLTNYDE